MDLPLLSAYHCSSLQPLVQAVTPSRLIFWFLHLSLPSPSFLSPPPPPSPSPSLPTAPISSNTSNQDLPLVTCSLGCLSPTRLLKVRQPRHIPYVTVNSSFSPSITTSPPFFILILCSRFPSPLLMLIHICRIGQVIKSSDQVIKPKQLSGSSVCGVTSGSRFDRQEFCGSGVMSHVELLAPRVDLHGNTSLSSSQRVYFYSFLSLSPLLSPSLSLSALFLPSLSSSPLPPSLSSLANSK